MNKNKNYVFSAPRKESGKRDCTETYVIDCHLDNGKNYDKDDKAYIFYTSKFGKMFQIQCLVKSSEEKGYVENDDALFEETDEYTKSLWGKV
jgi:hypothetical protein